MKLPIQTKTVERKTYRSDAVTAGANASFSFASLLPVLQRAAVGALGAL